jgi:hypothetical protein
VHTVEYGRDGRRVTFDASNPKPGVPATNVTRGSLSTTTAVHEMPTRPARRCSSARYRLHELANALDHMCELFLAQLRVDSCRCSGTG